MESRKSTGGVRYHCCNICGEVKPITLEYFYSDGHTRDGAMRFRTQCKSCLAMVRRLCRQGYVRDHAMAAVKRFITQNGTSGNLGSDSLDAGTGKMLEQSPMVTDEAPSRQLMGSQRALDATLGADAAHPHRSALQGKPFASHAPHAGMSASHSQHANNAEAERLPYREWPEGAHDQDHLAHWGTPDALNVLQSKLLQSSMGGPSSRPGAADADPRASMQTLAARILAQELLANNDAEIVATLFDLRRKQSERATLLNIIEAERASLARHFEPDSLHASAPFPPPLQQPPPSTLPAGIPVHQLAQLQQLLSTSLGVDLPDDALQRVVASLAAQSASPACDSAPRGDRPAMDAWASAPNNAASWLLQALGQNDTQRGADVSSGALGKHWPADSAPMTTDSPADLLARQVPKPAAMSSLNSMLRAVDAMQTADDGRGRSVPRHPRDLPAGDCAAWPVAQPSARLPEKARDSRNLQIAAEDHSDHVSSQLLGAAPSRSRGNSTRSPHASVDDASDPELEQVAVQLLQGLLGGTEPASKPPAANRAADDVKPAKRSTSTAADSDATQASSDKADARPTHDLRRSKNWSAIDNHFADSNPMRVCRACGECKPLKENFHVHRWREVAPGRRAPQTFYWHCKQCHNHISAAIRRGETRSLAVATIQVSRRAAAAETCAANNKLIAQVQEELKAAHSTSPRANEPVKQTSLSAGTRKCTCCNSWKPIPSFDHGDSLHAQLCTTCHKKIFKHGPPSGRLAEVKDEPKEAKVKEEPREVSLADLIQAATATTRQQHDNEQADAKSVERKLASQLLGLHPIATHSQPMMANPPLPSVAAYRPVLRATTTPSPTDASPTFAERAGCKRERGPDAEEPPALKQRVSEDLDASYASAVSQASRLGNVAGSEPLSPASFEGPCGNGEAGDAASTGVDVLAALQLLELKRGPAARGSARPSASTDSGHANIANSTRCAPPPLRTAPL